MYDDTMVNKHITHTNTHTHTHNLSLSLSHTHTLTHIHTHTHSRTYIRTFRLRSSCVICSPHCGPNIPERSTAEQLLSHMFGCR